MMSRPHCRLPRACLAAILVLLGMMVDAGPCTVCRNGEPITRPEKELNFTDSSSPIHIDSCGTLDLLMGFVDSESQDCFAIRQISSLCGCPVSESSCKLCKYGTALSDPGATLSEDTLLLLGDGYIAADGFTLTCELFEAMAYSYANDTDICANMRAAGPCQCSSSSSMAGNATTDDNVGVDSNGTERCTLCVNKDKAPFFEKELFTSPSLGLVTCGGLDSISPLYEKNSSECIDIQTLSKACGCETPQDACSLCPSGETVPEPLLEYEFLRDFNGDELGFEGWRDDLLSEFSCEVLDSSLSRLFVEGEESCFATQLRSGACGCTNTKTTPLIWTSRVSGILSIVVMVMRDRRKSSGRTKLRMHHQLILGMSIFDMLSSTGYASSLVESSSYRK